MSRILIGFSACPLTREAFEAKGHEVYTCDLLPERDGSLFHLRMDIWDAIALGGWDFALLHPMCTYLTCSAAWAFKDPDFNKYPGVCYHQRIKPDTLTGSARREARANAIGVVRRLLALPFPVAIENPAVSFVNGAIRPPTQVINPFEYGDDASKATGLWLSDDVPQLKPTEYFKPRLVCDSGHVFEYGQHKCPQCGSQKYLPRWANQTNSGQNRLSPSDSRWLERSETYPGIAAAMGDQWGEWLNTRVEAKE